MTDVPKEPNPEANLAEVIRRRFAPPEWLPKAGARRRGLDALTLEDIDAEVDAVRRETLSGSEAG